MIISKWVEVYNLRQHVIRPNEMSKFDNLARDGVAMTVSQLPSRAAGEEPASRNDLQRIHMPFLSSQNVLLSRLKLRSNQDSRQDESRISINLFRT